jgi:O-antigen/teichoic acid export membrane protein
VTTLSTVRSAPAAPPAPDLTGRDRIAWNVLVSWGGQLVFVAAGFLMPRLIDAHLGQRMLGIWDLSWSVVTTVGYSSLGVGSSTNRYVAKYRAARDVAGIRRATSSVFFVELSLGGIALLLTLLASLLVPLIMRERLGADGQMVAGLIALLGASVAVQMGLEVFRGVMTGCHRWDFHNAVTSGSYGIIVAGMAAALLSGGGLLSVAAVYFAGTVMTEIVRALIAHRVCPELRIRLAYAEWGQARSMVKFGAKSFLEAFAAIILGMGSTLLITGYLGPSALAVFSRPAGLVRQAASFVAKFAHVLTPTASALHGSGHREELGRFLIATTRQAVCLALPSMLFLSIMGAPILNLWMGSRYEEGLLLAVMALGSVPLLVQAPAMTILMGMNMHGRMAILMNAMALCGLGLGMVALRNLGWGLVATSVLLSAPVVIGQGIVLPIYTCRRVGVPLSHYLRNGFVVPIACALPFGVCAAVARLLLGHRPLLAILVGGVTGGLAMAPLYWYWVLSPGMRRQLVAGVARRLPRVLSTAAGSPAASVDRG